MRVFVGCLRYPWAALFILKYGFVNSFVNTTGFHLHMPRLVMCVPRREFYHIRTLIRAWFVRRSVRCLVFCCNFHVYDCPRGHVTFYIHIFINCVFRLESSDYHSLFDLLSVDWFSHRTTRTFVNLSASTL